MAQQKSFQYITYGAKVSADSIRLLIEHSLNTMLQSQQRPAPVCIWGTHGIGKTELVRDVAKAKGCAFVYVAPAQFEEMGDLIGMPKIADAADATQVTRFVPPEWTPRTEGPGIMLLDDVNRADDRILRGIMQLLQYYELISWSLPSKWLIVLTANPDGGDYSVTPLDDAMLNRMLHVTMEFDARAWAQWAERAGVDERGINFVLTYPELVNNRRTTPRSLVQFFQAIQSIDNLQEQLPLVKMLGDASLDEETTQGFLNFIQFRLDQLPSPVELLDATDFSAAAARLERLAKGPDGSKRLDILSVVVTRLNNYAKLNTEQLKPTQMNNLQQFILLEWLPNDLRLAMAQELVATKHPTLTKLYAVPAIGQLLLEKM
jgi:MoxR-like ATPase